MSSGRGDAIDILPGSGVRLRRAEVEEYEQVALPWYQDPEVLQLSEGGEAPYDHAQIRRMFGRAVPDRSRGRRRLARGRRRRVAGSLA